MQRLLSLLFVYLVLAGASVALASDLSAADIVARNVAARGGLEAWRGVHSIRLAGDMDAGGKKDTRLPFVLSMKRPHKSRLEIVFQDQTALQVYDGSKGWKQRPYLHRDDVEPLTRSEAESAAAAAELDGPLIDYAHKGSKVLLLGMDTVEGKKAYQLRVTPKVGPAFHVWVDASNYLELKVDGEPRRLDGRWHKVAVYYRNYKKVNGLALAHTLETVVEGVAQTHTIRIESVKINPPLSDGLFALQAAPVSANRVN